MVPDPDRPISPKLWIGPGPARNGCRDRTRTIVQVVLAFYLSPVILLVCVIGCGSVLAARIARIASKITERKSDREGCPNLMAGEGKTRPSLASRSPHSHAAR